MLSVKAALSDCSLGREEELERILTSKESLGSFSELSDRFDSVVASNFVNLLHSIATARKDGKDNYDTFLKRCSSVGNCLKIMLDYNERLQAYPLIFHNRFVGGFNAVMGELVLIDQEQYKEMSDVMMQFLELFEEFISLPRGDEVVSLLLFTRIPEFLSDHVAQLPPDLASAMFDSILAFLPRWVSMDSEVTAKLLHKIRPNRSDKFLPVLFESLFQIGDISFQSAVVLLVAYLGNRDDYTNVIVQILTKCFGGSTVESLLLKELVDSFARIFEKREFSAKLTAATEFLHAANLAVGARSVHSLPVKDMTINGEKLICPRYSQSELGDSKFWANFNYLTTRFSTLLASENGELVEFMHLPPNFVKRVDFFSDPESPRSLSITLLLSHLPEIKCLPKVSFLHGEVYQFTLSFSKSSESTKFIKGLKLIYPLELFVDLSSSPQSQRPNSWPKTSEEPSGPKTNWDLASNASRVRTAFVVGGDTNAKGDLPKASSTREPEIHPVSRARNPKTYGRKSAPSSTENQVVGENEPHETSPEAQEAPVIPEPVASKHKNSVRKSSITPETRKSLDPLFSAKPNRNAKSHSSEKVGSYDELPEITSSVYSASDFSRKLNNSTRKSVAFHPPPSPVVEITISTEKPAEESGKQKNASELAVNDQREKEPVSAPEPDSSAVKKRGRPVGAGNKAKSLVDTPALPKQAQRKPRQRARTRPPEVVEGQKTGEGVDPRAVKSAPSGKQWKPRSLSPTSEVDENEHTDKVAEMPKTVEKPTPGSSGVRKQPVRKAVLDAENRKRTEKEQLKDFEGATASSVGTKMASTLKRSKAKAGVEVTPLFDESEFAFRFDDEEPGSPPKRSRKSTAKKAPASRQKSRPKSNKVSLEEQMDAAFANGVDVESLPSLIVEEGVVDEATGCLISKKGIAPATDLETSKPSLPQQEKPALPLKKPTTPALPDRSGVLNPSPIPSIERMRHNSFEDYRPTDDLNEIIDTNFEQEMADFPPPPPLVDEKEEKNSSLQKQKQNSFTPLTGRVEPIPVAMMSGKRITPQIHTSPIITSKSANRKQTGPNKPSAAIATASSSGGKREKTPDSWSESFPENENASKSPQISQHDVDIITIVERLVGDTVEHVSQLSTKGEKLVDKIANVNEAVRTCSEQLRGLERSISEYSVDVKQLKAMNKNLEAVRQMLHNRRHSSDVRRRLDEDIERLFGDTENRQNLTQNPAEFQKMLKKMLNDAFKGN